MRPINGRYAKSLTRQLDQGVVCAPLVRYYLDICASQGLSRQSLMAAATLTEHDLFPPDGWVQQSVIERLCHSRLRLLPDPLMGLSFATAMEPTGVGLLGFLALSSPSVLTLFSTLQNYGRLVSNIFSLSLLHRPGRAYLCIDFRYNDPLTQRHSTEWALACFAYLTHRLNPGLTLASQFSVFFGQQNF